MVGRFTVILGISSLLLVSAYGQNPPQTPPFPSDGPPPPPHEEDNSFRRDDSRPKPPPLFIRDERFQKMLELAVLPESELDQAISKLPRNQKITDEQKKRFAQHVREFRDRIRSEALVSAKKLNLTLTSESENAFIKAFWQKQIEIEKKLHEEIEPKRKELTKVAEDELKSQFGSATAK